MRRFCYLLIFFCTYLQAQEVAFSTGLLPDDGTYDKLPQKAELKTRSYKPLPNKYSLMQYCPEVKSQSHYETCTGWATAYAARTIAEAIKYGWTDKAEITKEAFSPLFVYAQIKDVEDTNDNDCQKGTHIHKALQLMKEKGVSKYSQFNVLCADRVRQDLKASAIQYKIDDFFTLFNMMNVDEDEKIRKVKKSLTEECPVVIAMHLPESFHHTGAMWNGQDINPQKHGYHAMCVVGYDDNINGGAFQIMNSWGTNWGNKGFVWVKYRDFAKFVDQAYEIFVRKDFNYAPQPQPKPQPIQKPQPIVENRFSGDVELSWPTGEKMIPVLDSENGYVLYRMAVAVFSGDYYWIDVSNYEPAYVYVFSYDPNNNVKRIFPHDNTISAALTYRENEVALHKGIRVGITKGTDYVCFLYSRYALEFDNLMNEIKNTKGTFPEKVKYVLRNNMVQLNDIRPVVNKIGFSARSEKDVVPVIVEINHK